MTKAMNITFANLRPDYTREREIGWNLADDSFAFLLRPFVKSITGKELPANLSVMDYSLSECSCQWCVNNRWPCRRSSNLFDCICQLWNGSTDQGYAIERIYESSAKHYALSESTDWSLEHRDLTHSVDTFIRLCMNRSKHHQAQKTVLETKLTINGILRYDTRLSSLAFQLCDGPQPLCEHVFVGQGQSLRGDSFMQDNFHLART